MRIPIYVTQLPLALTCTSLQSPAAIVRVMCIILLRLRKTFSCVRNFLQVFFFLDKIVASQGEIQDNHLFRSVMGTTALHPVLQGQDKSGALLMAVTSHTDGRGTVMIPYKNAPVWRPMLASCRRAMRAPPSPSHLEDKIEHPLRS